MFDKRSQCKYYCENHYDYGIPHFVPQQFCITVYVVIGNSLLVLAISVLLLLSNITCLYVRWVHIHRYYYFVLLCFTNFDNCFCWFFNCHCFFIIQGIHLYIRFKFQIILPRLILMSYQLQNVMFEPRFSSNSIRLFFFNLFFMFYSFFHHSASSYFYHSYMPDT